MNCRKRKLETPGMQTPSTQCVLFDCLLLCISYTCGIDDALHSVLRFYSTACMAALPAVFLHVNRS
jgi:hypothetical protein